MKSLLKNKKGIVGLDIAGDVVLSIVVIAFLLFAAIFLMGTLNSSNILTAGSLEKNYSTAVFTNSTIGFGTLAQYFPTIMTVLAVVIIFGLFALIIYVLYRLKGGSSAGV